MSIISFLYQAEFRIKNLEEAYILAKFLSEFCPNHNIALVGISEILLNAIEHGNLDITCEEKTILQKNGEWITEIERRLKSPKYSSRYVTVHFIKNKTEIILKIIDQGKGFNWQKHQDEEHQQDFSTHGRGLDIAKKLVFSSMVYSNKGNIVTCTIPLPQEDNNA